MFNPFFSCLKSSKIWNTLFSIALICFLFTVGCTSFVKKPNPPTSPSFAADLKGTVEWPSPDKPLLNKYETVVGSKNPVTIDDVTVEVLSIDEEVATNDYTIQCNTPDDKSITFPLPPSAQVKITNGTDHMIALGQTAMLTGTVIRLEDKSGNAFDLYSGIGSWRKEAQKPINDYYDKCTQVVDEGFASAVDNYRKEKEKVWADYKNDLDGDYAKKYKEYVSDFELQNKLECLNPFWILGCLMGGPGSMDKGPNDKIDTAISPNVLTGKSASELSAATKKLTQKGAVIKAGIQQEISKKRSECIVKIAQMEPKKIIYSGTYPTITVFPKKSVTISVPFVKKEGKYLDEINFMLYDLPTKVDAAGVPTKRSNFDIKLKKVKN